MKHSIVLHQNSELSQSLNSDFYFSEIWIYISQFCFFFRYRIKQKFAIMFFLYFIFSLAVVSLYLIIKTLLLRIASLGLEIINFFFKKLFFFKLPAKNSEMWEKSQNNNFLIFFLFRSKNKLPVYSILFNTNAFLFKNVIFNVKLKGKRQRMRTLVRALWTVWRESGEYRRRRGLYTQTIN